MITLAFLNIYLGLSPYSTDLHNGKAQSLIYITTPFITLIAGVISSNLKLIFTFPKAFPLSS
jgi:hypothetical protein